MPTNQEGNRRLGHVPALDGVRALAVLGVISSHIDIPRTEGSGIGVLVFFVLSGFLITKLLLEENDKNGRVNLGAFYVRRALRLLPALAMFLVAISLYAVVLGKDPTGRITLGSIPAALFYYANWEWFFHGVGSLAWVGHTWSLSIEEQFYLAWPVTMIVLLQARWRRAFAAIVAACCVVLVGRLLAYNGPADYHLLFGTHMLADQLLMGCALALFIHRGSDRRRAQLAKASGIALVPAGMFLALAGILVHPESNGNRFFLTFGWSLVAIASCVIVARIVLVPTALASRLLGFGPLAYIGRISYGMYLWHILLLAASLGPIHNRALAWTWDILGTVLVASASYWLVERRALLLKERFAAGMRGREQGVAEQPRAPAS